MRRYAQLAQEQRYQIYSFLKAGFKQRRIAREIGVHKSTISREIKRNKGLRGYRPVQAQKLRQERRQDAEEGRKYNRGLEGIPGQTSAGQSYL